MTYIIPIMNNNSEHNGNEHMCTYPVYNEYAFLLIKVQHHFVSPILYVSVQCITDAPHWTPDIAITQVEQPHLNL